MRKLRILYVASEMNPFMQQTEVAEFVRQLPQAMQEKGMEIRILVPRFGVINERRNRLHEVVRLSGINIAVGDEEKPLIIKVASVPNAKLQVYFIDNDDYFQRKSVFVDKDNQFHQDNHERAIFFCKGVMETVKKLGWAPDVVHCNDWMTSLVPLYMKTRYKNDPIFKNAKSVLSVYNNSFQYKFGKDLLDKVKMLDVDDSMIQHLKTGDFEGFIKVGAQFADSVIKHEDEYNSALNKIFDSLKKEKKLSSFEKAKENIEEEYYNFYNELVD